MIRKFTYLLLGVLMMPIVAFSQEKESGPSRRAAWERRITKDPVTGLIPLQELEKGRNQVEQFYKTAKKSKTSAAIPNVSWKERGPNNIGGRTRAIMWDPQNGTFTPKKKKVWAGGVAGGLWYNNDITDANSSWIKVNDFWDNIAISWIAHDPSNKLVLYVATGERSGGENSTNTGQSAIAGGGIWKSIDGGTSWNRLASTIPDYVTTQGTLGNAFREIWKVIVLNNGHVLALTKGGIWKSIDGGVNWAYLSGTGATTLNTGFSSIADMELGSDGILYVAEGNSDSVEPRILKSTDNTITDFVVCPLPAVPPLPPVPPATTGLPALGRVEIVLAQGTQGANQVIYAVSAANGTPAYRFFLKSTNGGTTWTPMTPSTIKNGTANEAIFGTQGDWGLILGTHKTKPNALYFGGTSFDVSTDGGTNWNDFVKNSEWSPIHRVMHADHHAFEANPDNNDEAIFGNDGGVYYSNNWSAPSTTLTALNIQARNKNYNVTQYFAVDLHPTATNGLVAGGTQDNGSHAIRSDYNAIGEGTSISTGDGALTFIDQVDPNIVITSYVHISPDLHKTGGTGLGPEMTPHFSKKGQFINPAEYDSPAHTYYANFTYDAKAPVTGSVRDTLAIRYKITTSTVPADYGYTYTPSYLTYPVNATVPPIKVSFLKLDKTTDGTSNRILYIGTSDGDVYKTSSFGINGDQGVFLTKIMDKTTTGIGNVSSIDFGTDNNTIIVTKSNYNIKSVYYSTNANGGINAVWTSKDEATHGLPNIPIRYALINPVDTKQVLLATDLGVWSTTDITASNPDWKETNETLAKVRCDMLKYRASDNTLIVGTHGRGIFSTQLNICTPPTGAIAGSNSPVNEGGAINLTSSSTGGTSQSWFGSTGYSSTAQNPLIIRAAAGTYTYTVTIRSSGTCVATATTSVVVNPAPPCTPPTGAMAGSNSPVTEGSPINLTSSSTGGTSQSWLGSNGYTSTAQNPVIATLAAGVYNYTVTITSSGTCVATATTSVRVNSAPATCTPPTVTAGSNSPITVGGNIFLTATFPNSGIAAWVGPNSYTSTGRAPIIAGATLAAAGVYTVTVASPSTSTCTVTLTVNVVVNPVVTTCTPPTAATAGSNSPVNVGGVIRLTSSAAGGASQIWSGPSSFTSFTQNPAINGATEAMAGVYTVTIRGSGTCLATVTATTMVVVGSPPPTSSVVFVNVANTNTTQNGTSWATAYADMQTALSSAPANSIYWVAKGVYKPTSTTDRNISFNIPNGAKLYGGFVGTETMLNQGNITANPTILSGEIGSQTSIYDNTYHVVVFKGANNTTILDGFTVTGGTAGFTANTPTTSSSTSLIPVSPTVPPQLLTISEGGGIVVDEKSSPSIANCTIVGNSAIQGGGLYVNDGGTPTVFTCTFMNNQATFGSAVYSLQSNPNFSNVLIAGNRGIGAMYNNFSNSMLTQITFAGNGGYNGAVFNSNSIPVIKNSILFGNAGPFNDKQSVVSNSIVEGGYSGIGNLDLNPQFVNLTPSGLAPTLLGDNRLTNTSPAIDAGDNNSVGFNLFDLANFPRIFNNRIVDMGAYEFQGSRVGGTVTSIVSGNWEKGTTWNIGRQPLAGDTVIINNNHIVTINYDGVVKDIELKTGGKLLYSISGIKIQTGL